MVTAQDGAPDPRIATATVTVHVSDIEDELPIFHLTTYNTSVPENTANYLVAHVKVSCDMFSKNSKVSILASIIYVNNISSLKIIKHKYIDISQLVFKNLNNYLLLNLIYNLAKQ